MANDIERARAAKLQEGEAKHTMSVAAGEGRVFLSLPNDGYIKLTPEQARQIAGRLFIQAAKAEGAPVPSIIALNVED